jgi:hypothetical protein
MKIWLCTFSTQGTAGCEVKPVDNFGAADPASLSCSQTGMSYILPWRIREEAALSKSATRKPGDLAAKQPAEKLDKSLRAKAVRAPADAESRIQSIKMRFGKSLAYLAK